MKRFLLITICVLSLSGCIPHKEYRSSTSVCTGEPEQCPTSSLIRTPEYLLGVVEFDDQGMFWHQGNKQEKGQLDALLDTLYAMPVDNGLLMVVFAHGWKHSASFDDDNVKSFQNILKDINKLELAGSNAEGRQPRTVVGVYLGWRGGSLKTEPLKELTFWDRKNTAEKVGHGAVTELLTKLESVKIIKNRLSEDPKAAKTRLVVIGHSFGGAVIYSALSQIMVERFIDRKGEAAPPETFGDLVILMNPAFEAARFTPLQQLAANRTYFKGQLPLVMVLTSKGDWATKDVFPIGRFFSTLFEKYQSKEEKAANKTAVGHYQPYITHTLYREEKPDQTKEVKKPLTEAKALHAVQRAKSLKTAWNAQAPAPGYEFEFDGIKLKHRAENRTDPLNPILMVSVDKKIIFDHNDIFKDDLVEFLRAFIVFALTRQ